MTIRLNHTIVPAHDKERSAAFLSEVLGLAAPGEKETERRLGAKAGRVGS